MKISKIKQMLADFQQVWGDVDVFVPGWNDHGIVAGVISKKINVEKTGAAEDGETIRIWAEAENGKVACLLS